MWDLRGGKGTPIKNGGGGGVPNEKPTGKTFKRKTLDPLKKVVGLKKRKKNRGGTQHIIIAKNHREKERRL